MWDFSVIKDILMNPVYTGAIASQKKEYRFKIGTIGEKKPEEWIVVENQHEPLVDRKTFDIVQRKLKSRQRPRQTGEISRSATPTTSTRSRFIPVRPTTPTASSTVRSTELSTTHFTALC